MTAQLPEVGRAKVRQFVLLPTERPASRIENNHTAVFYWDDHHFYLGSSTCVACLLAAEFSA